jgi:hypothetical protein
VPIKKEREDLAKLVSKFRRDRMRKIQLAFLFVLLIFSLATHAQDNSNTVKYGKINEYEIGGLRVDGTKYLDGNALISLTGLKVGDRIKIPGDGISQAIKKLWKHGGNLFGAQKAQKKTHENCHRLRGH